MWQQVTVAPFGAMLAYASGEGGEDEGKFDRRVIIAVRQVGLKRYVEFMSSHIIINKTDETIEIVLSTNDGFSAHYHCLPGESTPICYEPHWHVIIRMRPSPEWPWTEPFAFDAKAPTLNTSSVKRPGLMTRLHFVPFCRKWAFKRFSFPRRTSTVSALFTSPHTNPKLRESLSSTSPHQLSLVRHEQCSYTLSNPP